MVHHDKAGFTRVGGPTKAFHEQVHTVLVNEAKDAVGTCADGLGDVEDVSAPRCNQSFREEFEHDFAVWD